MTKKGCCVVPNCRNASEKTCGTDVVYQKIPPKEKIRRRWIRAIEANFDDFVVDTSTTIRVCSDHFETSNIIIGKNGKKSIQLEAVPTIFIKHNVVKKKEKDPEPIIKPRHQSRRAASKEALKQMQSILLDDEDEIPDLDYIYKGAVKEEPIPAPPVVTPTPKKKYKLSHRKSSDGNDREVLVLKSIKTPSITNHYVENNLDLECWVEELEPCQKERNQKLQNEEKELQNKLDELIKSCKGEVIYKGELTTIIEVSDHVHKTIQAVQASQTAPPPPPVVLNSIVASPPPNYQVLGYQVVTPTTQNQSKTPKIQVAKNLQAPPPPVTSPPVTPVNRPTRPNRTKAITPAATKSPASTPVATRSAAATPVATRSAAASPVATRSAAATPSVATRSAAATPVATRSAAATPVGTRSATITPVATRSAAATPVPTKSGAATPAATKSAAATPVATRSAAASPVATRSAVNTPVGTRSAAASSVGTRGASVAPVATRAAAAAAPAGNKAAAVTPVGNKAAAVTPVGTKAAAVTPVGTRAAVAAPVATRSGAAAVGATRSTGTKRPAATPPPPAAPPSTRSRGSNSTSISHPKPTESSVEGGLLTGTNTKPKAIVDLTADDGRPLADSREVSFNKLQGKTFPSLVVVARPQLRVTDVNSDRVKLDAKVKSVLMCVPAKFTEWLIQQGIVKSEQKCTTHNSNQLKLGMYSDVSKFPYSGGYVWISECCPQKFVSVFSGSIFEGSPHPPLVILKLLYHWSCQTNIQNVVQWVKVDNLYIKGMYTWLRCICTVALQSHVRKLGGPNIKVEVGVISLGTTSQDGNSRQVKVEVLGVLETSTKLLRLRAIEPLADGDRNYKKRFTKILEPIVHWVHSGSTIVTDLTVDKATLHQLGFSHVIQTTTNVETVNSNKTIMEYLRKIVPRMFQNTLSLLSRQIIQQFLDELVWREWFGTTSLQAFENLVSHIAEQTKSESSHSLIIKLGRVAQNPFKVWSFPTTTGSTPSCVPPPPTPVAPVKPVEAAKKRKRKEPEPPKATIAVPTEICRPPKSNSPDVPTLMVPLENYYYGTIDNYPPKMNVQLSIKCPVCKEVFSNNIVLMNHLFQHAHNVVKDGEMCRYCLTSVQTQGDLISHIASSHPAETKHDNGFICLICETQYMNPFVLGKHMSKEHCPAELPYQCGTCGYRCSNHKQAIDHFYKQHENGPTIQCPFCLKSTTVFSSSRNMAQNMHFFIQHLQKHQKKTYAKRCGKCNLWFVQKEVLKDHHLKMHTSQRGKTGLVPWMAPRNGVMVPKSKMDKYPSDGDVINFTTLFYNLTKGLKCKECNELMDTNKHFASYENCQNPNCQYATCCANAMQDHNSKCNKINKGDIPAEKLPCNMFCICGFSSEDGNQIAKHLAICEKKSAYPSLSDAKSASVTHSMLDVLGLVRKPDETERKPSKTTKKVVKKVETEDAESVTSTEGKKKRKLDDTVEDKKADEKNVVAKKDVTTKQAAKSEDKVTVDKKDEPMLEEAREKDDVATPKDDPTLEADKLKIVKAKEKVTVEKKDEETATAKKKGDEPTPEDEPMPEAEVTSGEKLEVEKDQATEKKEDQTTIEEDTAEINDEVETAEKNEEATNKIEDNEAMIDEATAKDATKEVEAASEIAKEADDKLKEKVADLEHEDVLPMEDLEEESLVNKSEVAEDSSVVTPEPETVDSDMAESVNEGSKENEDEVIENSDISEERQSEEADGTQLESTVSNVEIEPNETDTEPIQNISELEEINQTESIVEETNENEGDDVAETDKEDKEAESFSQDRESAEPIEDKPCSSEATSLEENMSEDNAVMESQDTIEEGRPQSPEAAPLEENSLEETEEDATATIDEDRPQSVTHLEEDIEENAIEPSATIEEDKPYSPGATSLEENISPEHEDAAIDPPATIEEDKPYSPGATSLDGKFCSEYEDEAKEDAEIEPPANIEEDKPYSPGATSLEENISPEHEDAAIEPPATIEEDKPYSPGATSLQENISLEHEDAAIEPPATLEDKPYSPGAISLEENISPEHEDAAIKPLSTIEDDKPYSSEESSLESNISSEPEDAAVESQSTIEEDRSHSLEATDDAKENTEMDPQGSIEANMEKMFEHENDDAENVESVLEGATVQSERMDYEDISCSGLEAMDTD